VRSGTGACGWARTVISFKDRLSSSLFLKKIRVDPALASGVILTTFTDCIGFAALLGLGAMVL